MPSLVEQRNESCPLSALPPVTAVMPLKHSAENPSWLYSQFELDSQILLLDCRPYADYCQAHVEGAINLHIPSLILRRLKKGNLPVSNLLNSDAAKAKFERRSEVDVIVIYDESSRLSYDGEGDMPSEKNPVLEFLLGKLSADNKVCYLDGGYNRFEECYPHLCQCGEGSEVNKTVLSLAGLKIVDSNNNNNDVNSLPERISLDSSLILHSSPPSPYCKESRLYRPEMSGAVEILPRLYLGCKKDASDWQQLSTNGITDILNVTDDLPNYFEHHSHMTYMQLAVQDNWTGNLGELFPKAFDFIDSARDAGRNVLVHCVGGISRSSTVIIAYLMVNHACQLNDAYDFVKQRKSNVAPNFNFMGQLLDFERSRSFPETPNSSVSTLSSGVSFTSDCEISSSSDSINDDINTSV